MAIDPNEDYRQAEAILNGQMDERDATPAARQLALRRMNQPLRYPDKPKSMGGGKRPRGPTPIGASSLSGGMVGAPSVQMSPEESMLAADQTAASTISRSYRENGLVPQDPDDPFFSAQETMRNNRENPHTQGDEGNLDQQIRQRNQNSKDAGVAYNPRVAVGTITDKDRQAQREWNAQVNAEPGSEMQQRFNKPGYDAYWAERTEDNRRSAGRQRFARQQELDNMSPEEYEAMLQKGRESMAERKLRIRNAEVAKATGEDVATISQMDVAQRDEAMLGARDRKATKREDSYRFQAQLGGGTVNRETSRIDALLSRLSPEARDRAMVQMLAGGGMGANEVEAAGLQLNARNQIGGGLGQGGGANNPLVQAQAAGANQQNAQNAQGQRVINENSIIGDHYAPPGSLFGWDTFDEREQNQAVQDLINNQNYTPAQATDAVRRIARERRSKVHI